MSEETPADVVNLQRAENIDWLRAARGDEVGAEAGNEAAEATDGGADDAE